MRLIGDLVIGAFFAFAKDNDRQKERDRRLDLVKRWLSTTDLAEEDALKAQLGELQAELKATQVPFHWMIEFPEVFRLERADPLDAGKRNGAAMVDAFVGNPPFLGGKRISTDYGSPFSEWLVEQHSATRNSDLVAHFFRRCASLLGGHGTLGLISTNTLSQGDTRRDGLFQLVSRGFKIYEVALDLPWPGDAAVTVHVVWIAIGKPAKAARVVHDGVEVEQINSLLKPRAERIDPTSLGPNTGCSFNGVFTRGDGFVLENEEVASIASKLTDAERRKLRPYLGGEEINTSAALAPHRSVIDVSDLLEDQLDSLPTLKALLEERVKPYRLALGSSSDDTQHRRYWWRFARSRPEMRAATSLLSRCLVNSIHSKYLVFAFQEVDRIFSHALNVFALEDNTPFAVLQSRIHECWARLLSSSMKTDLRYAASDCFETFPFPAEDPRAVLPDLERIGKQLYAARAAFMLETEQGLTKTYNALKDSHSTDERVLALRTLHEQMDSAVLAAYDWSDIPVPPFCITTDEHRAQLQAFEDEVLDRLFLLNAERAKKEAALGRGSKKKPAPKKKLESSDAAAPEASGGKQRKKKPPANGQGNLGWD